MTEESTASIGTAPDQPVEAQGPPIFMMGGLMPGLEFGVLRRNFRNWTNDAREWVHRKLHPDLVDAAAVHSMSWRPTCHRHDVLLPPSAPDTFLNPSVLLNTFEGEAGTVRKDLVIHIKLTALDDGTRHDFWERARHFAGIALARDPCLPVVLALHDPSVTVMRRPPKPHIHIMAPARQLTARGWGNMTDLASDASHAQFAEIWAKTK